MSDHAATLDLDAAVEAAEPQMRALLLVGWTYPEVVTNAPDAVRSILNHAAPLIAAQALEQFADALAEHWPNLLRNDPTLSMAAKTARHAALEYRAGRDPYRADALVTDSDDCGCRHRISEDGLDESHTFCDRHAAEVLRAPKPTDPRNTFADSLDEQQAQHVEWLEDGGDGDA